MMLITSLFFSMASLSLLAATPAAQAGPVPNITSVPDRKAYAPGNVAILGSDLGLATSVKVNGVPTPIVRINPNRIVVGPVAPLDPGFGTVEVISGHNSDTAQIQFLPTLRAIQRGVRLTLKLNNGDTGTYVVRYSYANPFNPG